MSDYEEDMRIIESATDGPWEVVETGDFYVIADLGKYVVTRTVEGDSLYQRIPQGIDAVKADAEHIARFNPSYTKQLVAKAMERDALAERVKELKEAMYELMQKHEEPYSDYYKELLK